MDTTAATGLWSWDALGDEDTGAQQRHERAAVKHAVAPPADRPAAVAQLGVIGVDARGAGSVVLAHEAAQSFHPVAAAIDVLGPERDVSDALWAGLDVGERDVGLDRRSAAEGPVPTKVHDRFNDSREDNEPVHARILSNNWEDLEPDDLDMGTSEPWAPGFDGKGLISPEGQLLAWRTNERGEPHHDAVAAEHQFPYAAKVAIRPNGRTLIPSPDPLHLFGMAREEADAHLAREAPKYGLRHSQEFTAKARVCPTCNDPLKGEHGTFCPRCQWSEDNANIDSDPLSNPPDPTRDMHRGIQSRIIPSHRWDKWLPAVEDLVADAEL